MIPIRHSFFASALLCSLILPALCMAAHGQTAPPAAPPLPLKAALVLTPEFCATETSVGAWGINQEKFKVGNAACAELEPALKGVFSTLTRVDAASSAGDAQVVLVPKFGDIAPTQPSMGHYHRELLVSVEWTVKDKSGKTVWLETIQGSAKRSIGNGFTHNKNLKRIVADSVKEAAQQSAAKMSASPELRKLTNGNSSSQTDRN